MLTATFLSSIWTTVEFHFMNRMSRVQIGGAGGRRNVRLSRMQQRTVLFSDMPWMWWWWWKLW